jgi:iron only hydrogenase large subunit-like protein
MSEMIEFKLVVLNPLIEKILNKKDYSTLINKIRNGGCKIESLEAAQKLLKTAETEVKMRYKFLLDGELKGEWPRPVIDGRCPKIKELIHKEFPRFAKHIAPIDSILITNARRQANMARENAVIVAPCSYFELKKIEAPSAFFLAIGTWKEFKEKIDFHPKQKKLKKSPVPLGFFNEPLFGNLKVYSASGAKRCRKLLRNCPVDAELLELLWCKNGCRNGDGL